MLNHRAFLTGISVFVLSATAACATARVDTPPANSVEEAWIEAGPYEIKDDTLICWRVTADKSLMAHFDNDGRKVDANLGPAFERSLNEQHEELFGQSIPYAQQVIPYLPDAEYPPCKDEKSNIIIDGRYELRNDGTPFQATYTIKQGSNVDNVSYQVNLLELFDKGIRVRKAMDNDLQAALFDDVNAQAINFIKRTERERRRIAPTP